MTRIDLRQRLKQDILIIDGAMGTQLIERGVDQGQCNENLNLESPEIVEQVNSVYFQAGSDAVITNTFGASKYALARHSLDDKVTEINLAAAEIARRAVGEEGYVLGDIGPTGDFLAPLGTLKPDELTEAFATQAKALEAGGADGFIVETMTAIEESLNAVKAIKSCSDKPVFASMAFDVAGDEFRTMMGVDPATAVQKLAELDVDAVGFNCGSVPMDKYIELAEIFVEAVKNTGKDIAVLAEPNAGMPELLDGKPVYKTGPEDFAQAVQKIKDAGVTIIGGCCGTSPDHIKALAEKLRS